VAWAHVVRPDAWMLTDMQRDFVHVRVQAGRAALIEQLAWRGFVHCVMLNCHVYIRQRGGKDA
jgi:hypothetical protein